MASSPPARSSVVLVVPCYHAERWMDAEAIIEWLARVTDPQMLVRLLFVHEFHSLEDRVARKINRWLDHIAYSAPSRSHPGRVRIMQLLKPRKRSLGRSEALREAIIEALQWPEHLGGPPDLIGLWSADLAVSAPFSDAEALALSLARQPSAKFLVVPTLIAGAGDADRGQQRGLISPALNALACLAIGIPQTEHAALSDRSALFLRVTPTLHAAVATRFRTPRLLACELFARYRVLHAGDAQRLEPLLVCEMASLSSISQVGLTSPEAEGGGNQDGVDYHGRSYDTSSISVLRILHGLLMIRILYHWFEWPSGSIKQRTLLVMLSLLAAIVGIVNQYV